MSVETKLMKTLAAIGQATTYTDIAAATGIETKLLMSNVANLKRRGYIERVNDGEAPRVIAYFRRTTAGDEQVGNVPVPEVEPYVAQTTVQRAIQRRPLLATVWEGA